MPAKAHRLQLNLFNVDFSRPRIRLPARKFADRREAREFLRSLPPSTRGYPANQDGDTVLFLFDGSADIEGVEPNAADVTEQPYLASKMIDNALWSHFRGRGFQVRRDRVLTTVLEQQPVIVRKAAVVRRGVSFQVKHPFEESPSTFCIVASWQTPAEFILSIADPTLKAMAFGHSVIYKPIDGQGASSPELREFRSRFIGRVRAFTSDNEAVVYCRDYAVRLLSLEELYLEASPSVLAEYDRRLATTESEPLWIEMLKLNHTLSDGGRRNTAVLHDRLKSICRFLGHRNRSVLELPATKFDDVTIRINLEPITVAIGADV